MNSIVSFWSRVFIILLFFTLFLNPILSLANGTNTNNNSSQDSSEGESNENNNEEVNTTIYLREAFPGQESTIDGGQGSLSLLAEYVSMIFKYTAALGSIIAVLVIMFAGFQLMVSGEGSEALGNAKTMIQKTLTGLALLFLAGLILYTVNPNFYIFS